MRSFSTSCSVPSTRASASWIGRTRSSTALRRRSRCRQLSSPTWSASSRNDWLFCRSASADSEANASRSLPSVCDSSASFSAAPCRSASSRVRIRAVPVLPDEPREERAERDAEKERSDVHAILRLECGLLSSRRRAVRRMFGQRPRGGGPGGSRDVRTVVLVSLDGFRWDYLDRGLTPNLSRLAREGVRAEAMVPVFPTKTFPNHLSIVTGRYPVGHGIVGNVFTAPDIGSRLTLWDTVAVRDARFYLAEPIWVAAERQGRRTAPLFWPGSEAPIHGVLPSYTDPLRLGPARFGPGRPAAGAARPAARTPSRVPHALLQWSGQRGARLRARRAGNQGGHRPGGQPDRSPGVRAATAEVPAATS